MPFARFWVVNFFENPISYFELFGFDLFVEGSIWMFFIDRQPLLLKRHPSSLAAGPSLISCFLHSTPGCCVLLKSLLN
jgi:hypothetical protein